MKRFLLALLFITAIVSGPAFADGYVAPGSFQVLGGVGFASRVGFYAGAEMGIMPLNFSDLLKFNLAGRVIGSLNMYSTSDTWGTFSYVNIGVGAYGVMHWNLKNLKTGIDFVNHLDSFIGLGLGVVINSTSHSAYSSLNTTTAGAAFAYTSGLTYYVMDNLGISLDYNGLTGSSLGVTYKF
jgi:hypothetical protein